MYGKSIDMSAQPEKDMIIEYAELINVNNEKNSNSNMKFNINTLTAAPMELSMENNNLEMKNDGGSGDGRPLTPIKAAIHKQIETRTADGKRRITPMFIPLNQETTYKEFFLF